VVHQNPTAGTYAVATKTRQLFGVHAGRLADAGAVLSAPVGSLFNGTFAQTGKPDESGTATEARFAGTVSYVDPASPAYTVSVRGVSALVHVPSDGLAPPDLPAVGDDVVVTASIEAVPGPGPGGAGSPPATTTGPTGTTTAPTTTTTTQPPAGCAPAAAPAPEGVDTSLVEKTRKDSGPTTFLYLAGRVEATCPDSSQLALSADDAGESGAALTLAVADGIDLTKVEVGDPLIADAEIGDDGAMTVTGLASDDGAKGADDPSTAQGDLASGKRAAPGLRARHARSTVVAGFHEKLTSKHRTVNGIGGPRP
jgi:hypothetical protein